MDDDRVVFDDDADDIGLGLDGVAWGAALALLLWCLIWLAVGWVMGVL